MFDSTYLSLPDEQAESTIFETLQLIDATFRIGYATAGIMARVCKRRSLWQYRIDPVTGFPCRSWTRWLVLAMPSKSTAFDACRDIEALCEGVEEVDQDAWMAQLAGVRQSNFGTLKQLSTAVLHDPKVIEAAKTQEPEHFVETLRDKHPDQAIERKKSLRLNPDESQYLKIMEFVELAKERGCVTVEDAIEAACVNTMQDWQLEHQVEDSLRSEVEG